MVWPSLLWLLGLLLAPFESAEQIAVRAGADCIYGCIVYAETAVYEITRQDVTTIALLAKAESGPRFVREESAATVWAMVSRFAELNAQRSRSSRMSLTSLMRSYSAVLGSQWRTGGPKGYHPRITPRADAYADIGWRDLARIWRLFAIEFTEGEVANAMPGVVHVLARGFEAAAADHLIGPFYASTSEQHPGGNAYYATPETRWWSTWDVRIVPATARMDAKDPEPETDR